MKIQFEVKKGEKHWTDSPPNPIQLFWSTSQNGPEMLPKSFDSISWKILGKWEPKQIRKWKLKVLEKHLLGLVCLPFSNQNHYLVGSVQTDQTIVPLFFCPSRPGNAWARSRVDLLPLSMPTLQIGVSICTYMMSMDGSTKIPH